MGVTIKRQCKNCTKEFRINQKNVNNPKFVYCSICRKYQKLCEICGTEIFVQARTCSTECTNELKKKSYLKNCGAEHNFSRNSTSRKKWEDRLFKKEGIVNVFQRESVKDKCKIRYLKILGVENPSQSKLIKNKKVQTCLKNHGVKYPGQSEIIKKQSVKTCLKNHGVEYPGQSEIIKKQIRKTQEDRGLWLPLSQLSEYQIYRYNVNQITKNSLNKNGPNLKNYDKLKLNSHLIFKNKWSIDHKFSILEGFKNKISPEIISSIVNLKIMTIFNNSSKNGKCSISLQKLIHNYNLHENKISTTD